MRKKQTRTKGGLVLTNRQKARTAQESGAFRFRVSEPERGQAETAHTVSVFVLVPKSPMRQLPHGIVL